MKAFGVMVPRISMNKETQDEFEKLFNDRDVKQLKWVPGPLTEAEIESKYGDKKDRVLIVSHDMFDRAKAIVKEHMYKADGIYHSLFVADAMTNKWTVI